MSETYTTIIPNVKDEEGDDVSLKKKKLQCEKFYGNLNLI